MVCKSCRAFFRRAVQTKCHESYRCRTGDANCEVNVANRKACKRCRFDKCLRKGMKVNWVMSEEERENRQLTTVHETRAPVRAGLGGARLDPGVTREELALVNQIKMDLMAASALSMEEYLTQNPGFAEMVDKVGFNDMRTMGFATQRHFDNVFQKFR